MSKSQTKARSGRKEGPRPKRRSRRAAPGPAPKRRKTTHGMTCEECGSADVLVLHTRTHYDVQQGRTRVQVVRQEFACRKCGRRWWRRVERTERELRRYQAGR